MTNTVQKIAARAVVMHDGKVLMIRESSQYEEGTRAGKYDFPGGRIPPGESIEEGLRRETKEECGLEIEIGRPFFVGEWRPIVKGQQLQIFAVYFICTPKHTNVTLSKDHDAYEWIDPNQEVSADLMPPNEEVLKILIAL